MNPDIDIENGEERFLQQDEDYAEWRELQRELDLAWQEEQLAKGGADYVYDPLRERKFIPADYQEGDPF